MAIKRFVASKDTTITNAFKANLEDRGVSGNMGQSDVLEVFSIYGQASTSSLEKSRILVQFPIDDLSTDISSNLIPTGGVSYYLKLFNVKHAQTLPENFSLMIYPISSSMDWTEGHGLDMEEYSDAGVSNWESASLSMGWQTAGGDYYITPLYIVSFEKGYEDLEVEVTTTVAQWLSGSKNNRGFIIMMSGSHEDGTEERSYYTKKFFARSSEYFFKRPVIEARWDSSREDNRRNFYASSSMVSATDNTNTLYLYNRPRGIYSNIPSVGTGSIYLKIYTAAGGTELTSGYVTGGYVDTGIYSASLSLDTTSSSGVDVWYDGSLNTLKTGSSFDINSYDADENYYNQKYVISMRNLQPSYTGSEQNALFRIYGRAKNWSPNLYTSYNENSNSIIFNNMFYEVYRVRDDYVVIPFNTGSDAATKTSYDDVGNYFNLDLSMLEGGYMYGLRFSLQNPDNSYQVLNETFKFRVE